MIIKLLHNIKTNHEENSYSFALIPFFVFSQSKIVTGTVNDENNLPLVGVNITVDNSNIGDLDRL